MQLIKTIGGAFPANTELNPPKQEKELSVAPWRLARIEETIEL